MSNAKPAAEKTAATEETEIPVQKASDAKASAVMAIGDALKAVEEKRSEGMAVTMTLDENGEIQIQITDVEDYRAKKFVSRAKGVFQRNKKLVIATASLLAVSVVVKVLASRQEELELAGVVEDEIVESSDQVSTEA